MEGSLKCSERKQRHRATWCRATRLPRVPAAATRLLLTASAGSSATQFASRTCRDTACDTGGGSQRTALLRGPPKIELMRWVIFTCVTCVITAGFQSADPNFQRPKMEEGAFSAGDRQRASAALSMSCHARQPPARSRDDAVGEPPTPRAPEDGERTAPSHRPGLCKVL